MSPFMIFAFVLTIAYAIYYAVVIAKTCRAKKEHTNSTEEVFDLEGMEEEESVQVSESGDSFHVGSLEDKPADPTKSEEEDAAGQPTEEQQSEAEEKADRIQSALYEAEITSENGVTAPELHELLEGRRETLFKTPMKITRNEL